MNKVQFPNLNGLRFLAAFGVIIHHIEQGKSFYGLPNCWGSHGMLELGGRCVSFFFVLSGFLITYLLKDEQQLFGSINIRQFYVRRILRIWPLYYMIVVLSFFILPAFSCFHIIGYPPMWDGWFWKKLLLYVAFAGYIAPMVAPNVQYAGPLWSVGVEECFYLAWPWLVKYVRRRLAPLALLVVISLPLIRTITDLSGHGRPLFVLNNLRFDDMAVGALYAMLLHEYLLNPESSRSQRVIDFVFRRDIQLLNLSILLLILFLNAFSKEICTYHRCQIKIVYFYSRYCVDSVDL